MNGKRRQVQAKEGKLSEALTTAAAVAAAATTGTNNCNESGGGGGTDDNDSEAAPNSKESSNSSPATSGRQHWRQTNSEVNSSIDKSVQGQNEESNNDCDFDSDSDCRNSRARNSDGNSNNEDNEQSPKQTNGRRLLFGQVSLCAHGGNASRRLLFTGRVLQQRPLVGLSWTTRITMILVCASLFFAVFFALEFLIARMSALSLSSIGTQASAEEALIRPPRQPPSDRMGATSIEDRPKSVAPEAWCNIEPPEEKDMSDSGGDNRSNSEPKTYDFAKVFEDESDFGQIAAENRLGRLLSAHHSAIPFDPNLWHFSEPREYIGESSFQWLSGSLDRCLDGLQSLWTEVNDLILPDLDGNQQQKCSSSSRQSPMARANGSELIRLMRLLDAFGRPEAGSLEGHPFWLGSYTQCVQLDAKANSNGDNNNHLMKGQHRYCIGKFAFDKWLRRSDHSPATIKIGLCLPKQCDSSALLEAANDNLRTTNRTADHFIDGHHHSSNAKMDQIKSLIKKIAMLNFSPHFYYSRELILKEIYCLPLEEDRKLGFGARLLIVFILLWLALMVWFAWLRKWRHRRRRWWMWQHLRHSDRRQPQPIGPRHWLSWKVSQMTSGIGLSDDFIDTLAIDSSLEHFLETSPKAKRDESKSSTHAQFVDLNVLAGIKHLGCAGVIAGHVLLTNLSLGTSFMHTIGTIGSDLRTMLMLSLNNIVDTFFVISGLLVAYLMLKRSERGTDNKGEATEVQADSRSISKWLAKYGRVMLHRYVRTAPLYLLVYAFVKLIGPHLGSGPFWDYATNHQSLRGACQRESWIWPLTFACDFKPLAQHCVPAAWSVAVDLHFFWLMPIMVSLLKLKPRLAYATVCLLIIGSTARTISDYQSLLDYVSAKHFAQLRLHVFTVIIKNVAHAYSHPRNRFSPILIGVLGGQLLYRYEQRCLRKLKSASDQNDYNSSNNGSENKTADQQQHSNGSSQNTCLLPKQQQKNLDQWPNWFMSSSFGFNLAIAINVLFAVLPLAVQIRERLRGAATQYRYASVSTMGHGNRPPDHYSFINGNNVTVSAAAGQWDDQSQYDFDFQVALTGFVLIKPLWSICNCLIFLKLTTDLSKRSLIARLLSLRFWRILSKLNYAMLLVHFELILYEQMSRLALSPTTWTELVCKFFYAYLSSVLIGAVLYVLFEQPMRRLAIHLIEGKKIFWRVPPTAPTMT